MSQLKETTTTPVVSREKEVEVEGFPAWEGESEKKRVRERAVGYDQEEREQRKVLTNI